MRLTFALAAGLLAALPLTAETRQIQSGPVSITPVITDLNEPWAMGFLPDGCVLVTERNGRLWHIAGDGTRQEVAGVPDVVAQGQGGLLDVMVPRDFAETRQIYLSYAKQQGRGAGTALDVGTLSADGGQLDGVQTVYEMDPGSDGGRHFGSRIVEGTDGFVYLTIGDRGDRPAAQDLGRENGSVIRVSRDGAVPSDNPFAGTDGAQPEIWSYGHRNPQGAALDASGQLWVNEHGAQGGDEVNLVQKGTNYGWPVISYGRHYSGQKIGEGTEKAGMQQPSHYWDPSIAPSGMMFYSGTLWPEWEGDLFVGSLKFGLISRLEGDAAKTEVERIETPETDRIRDIREAPDGSIWFMSVGNGTIYRMIPAEKS
ncbi:PQQ-dependent sugar dehydrogenase [Actibacterium sp. 188UL27-1]|uniref:PQQ-dependent sugar dehydrogenase n=1 Tax=Actibacterium sp. 188UL27-1 TaxID=2786961 RepID=UPI001956A3BE|nr:PQQ-dependent sugar dehydrogenase [Actibacterium sp. 188UL27-1]MBM7067590.1 PQQ-dependent sugar dehydrogenase [Actibacterium sp. 188UL27-1]